MSAPRQEGVTLEEIVDLLIDASDKLSRVAPGQLQAEANAMRQYEIRFEAMRQFRKAQVAR